MAHRFLEYALLHIHSSECQNFSMEIHKDLNGSGPEGKIIENWIK